MTGKQPESRPALRKSVDAALHPALAGRVAPIPAAKPSDDTHGARLQKAAAPPRKGKRGANSDVLRPTKSDPAVKLTVEIPKSLRKRLRAQAKAEGVEVEQYAARLIAEGLG